MPGLAQLAGIGPLIEFGDRHVQVVGRRLRHLAEAEAQILWIRGDPVDLARELVSFVEDRKRDVSTGVLRFIRMNYSGVSTYVISKWLQSPEGRFFSIWQAVRDSGISYNECLDIICKSIDLHGWSFVSSVEWAIDIASNHAEFQQLVEIRSIVKSSNEDDGTGFINYDSIIRNFCREPFCMSPDSVLDMTLHQIVLAAKGDGDPTSDEREVEQLQMASKSLTSEEKRVIWEKHYDPIAANLSAGSSIMNGLRN